MSLKGNSNCRRTPQFVNLVKEITDVQELLVKIEKRARLGQQYEPYKKYARKLVQLQDELDRLTKDLRIRFLDVEDAKYEIERDRMIATMKERIHDHLIREDEYRKKYTEQLKQLKRSKADTFDLQKAQHDMAREQHVINLIDNRIIELNTESNAPNRNKNTIAFQRQVVQMLDNLKAKRSAKLRDLYADVKQLSEKAEKNILNAEQRKEQKLSKSDTFGLQHDVPQNERGQLKRVIRQLLDSGDIGKAAVMMTRLQLLELKAKQNEFVSQSDARQIQYGEELANVRNEVAQLREEIKLLRDIMAKQLNE